MGERANGRNGKAQAPEMPARVGGVSGLGRRSGQSGAKAQAARVCLLSTTSTLADWVHCARVFAPFARSPFRLFRLGVAVEIEHQRLSHIRLDDLFDELDVKRVLFENPQTLLRIEIHRDKKTPRIRFIRPSTAANIGGNRDLEELDSSLHHDHFELSSADIWLQFIENDVMEHELFRL